MTDATAADAGLDTELTTLDAAGWDEIVAGFDDACIEQTYDYAGARAGADRLRHLLVRREGKVVGAAQIVLARVAWLGAGVAFVKFGPLWRRTGQTADREHLAAAIRALRDTCAIQQNLMLRIMPAATPDHDDAAARALQALGFAHRPRNDATRYLIDLHVDAQSRRAGLKPKWRYNLKRAEKRGMRVAHSTDERDLVRFAALYGQVRHRKEFSDGPTAQELPELIASIPSALRPTLVLCTQESDLVAAALVTTLGDTAVYLFGASADNALALGAGYVLHWEISRWLESTSCRWYDLGGDCDNAGLRQFKSGMVGKTGATPVLPGDFDFCPSLRAKAAGTAAFTLRKLADAVRR